MLILLLNSETTNTNGAIKPCHSPNQKPATSWFSLVMPLNSLGLGAHLTEIVNNSRTSTNKAKEDFIAIPPLHCYVARARKVSWCPMWRLRRAQEANQRGRG